MSVDVNSRAEGRPSRLQVGLWLLTLAAAAALAVRNFDTFQTGAFRDDSHYALMARSVVHPDRAWLRQAPGLPNINSGAFPVGYPLALAPLVWAFPNSLFILKGASLAATLANLSLLFWGWRTLCPGRSYWWGLAATSLYAVWPWTILYSTAIMSEALFVTALLAAMLLSAQAAQGRRMRGWQLWWAAALAALIAIRAAGWLLAGGLAAYLLLTVGRRFWGDLARVAAGLALAGLAAAATTSVDLGKLVPGRYVAEQAQFISGENRGVTVTDKPLLVAWGILNARHIKGDYREAILPLGGAEREQALAEAVGLSSLPSLIGAAVSAALLAGYLCWLWRERWSVLQVVGLAYVPILVLWRWNSPRFLYPIHPQLGLAFLLSVELASGLAARAAGRGDRWRGIRNGVLTGVTLALLANFAARSLQPLESRPHIGDLRERSQWVAGNTAASAIVMTEEPLIDYLYGGRRTVRLPDAPATAGELAEYLALNGVDYVLIAPHTKWQIDYRPVYSENTAGILALIEGPALAGEVEQVYFSEAEAIRVFRVR